MKLNVNQINYEFIKDDNFVIALCQNCCMVMILVLDDDNDNVLHTK